MVVLNGFYVPVEGGCMRIVQKIVLQMIKGMTVLARYVWTFLGPKLCQVYFMTVKTLYLHFTLASLPTLSSVSMLVFQSSHVTCLYSNVPMLLFSVVCGSCHVLVH